LRERAFVDDVDGRGQTRNARDVASNGAFARGARADWNRFVALLSAARGDSEPLDALFSPFLSSVRNPAETAREAENGASSRRARANRRNAYADADFALDAKTKRRRTKTRERREDGEEASDDADENSADSDSDSDSDDDMAYAPLGVALLFAHAVDVIVQDANARVEVFESRVFSAPPSARKSPRRRRRRRRRRHPALRNRAPARTSPPSPTPSPHLTLATRATRRVWTCPCLRARGRATCCATRSCTAWSATTRRATPSARVCFSICSSS
jgi:hypothetical protein